MGRWELVGMKKNEPKEKNRKKHAGNGPELIVPAGDLEKLRIAVHYGADAVYAGYPRLNLRAYAAGFSPEEFAVGVQEARRAGVKIYAAVNIFAHNRHLPEAVSSLETLASLNVDALIIADPGLFQLAREIAPEMPVHLSTQAGVTNWRSARFWQQQGVRRIVLSRELSLKEIEEISHKTDAELEVFVHGSMCMAYSGRCLLSAYFTGRGANRGECTHPCRWGYYLVEESRPEEPLEVVEEGGGSFIFSSRDLNMIDHIPELVFSGVKGLKIEGRMKGIHYVATVTRVYREALDRFAASSAGAYRPDPLWKEELTKVTHRPYHTGFYFGMPEQVDSAEKSSYRQQYLLAGVVLAYDRSRDMVLVEQRNKFAAGDELEVLTPQDKPFSFSVKQLFDAEGGEIESAPHPRQRLWIPAERQLKPLDLLRLRKQGEDK